MSLRERLDEVQPARRDPLASQQPDGQWAATDGEETVEQPAVLPAQTAEAALAGRLESAAPAQALRVNEPDGHGDPFAAVKTRVHRAVIDRLGSQLFGSTVDDDLSEVVRRSVEHELTADRTPLTRDERAGLINELIDDIVGYGPLEPLLADDSVTEVMVNGYAQIYVERSGKVESTPASFLDDAHLMRIIDKIVSQVGRRIDEASPMVDARLHDGSRVNAIIPPLALRGPALTIRKFSRDPFSMPDLIAFGTVTSKAADFLSACVRGKLNVLISGGSGAGKTTMLNALSSFIPNEERIVTIEDAAELQLQQEHKVLLEARPPNVEGKGEITIRDLVRNALRMRPDRIVVGEVRGAETLDMLQAMNTGHDGSLTTIHANSPRDALSRIETLVLTAGVELPLRAIREQVSSALDLVVHLSRLVDGTRRVSHVTEVLRMESEVITLQDVFVAPVPSEARFDARSISLLGPLTYSGLKPHFLEKLAAHGITLPAEFFAPAELVSIGAARNRRDDR
jgi:pilus assembly protein CpaF